MEVFKSRDSQSNTTQTQLTQDSHFQRKMSCLGWNSNPQHSAFRATEAALLAGLNHTYKATKGKASVSAWSSGELKHVYICLWVFSCFLVSVLWLLLCFSCFCVTVDLTWHINGKCHLCGILIYSLWSWALFFTIHVCILSCIGRCYFKLVRIKFHTGLFVLVRAVMKRQHSL